MILQVIFFYERRHRVGDRNLNAMDRRAARRADGAPDPIALLERYLDFLERRGQAGATENK
jgi:hypothetical protein